MCFFIPVYIKVQKDLLYSLKLDSQTDSYNTNINSCFEY